MDEAHAHVLLDIGGRFHFDYKASFHQGEKIGEFPTEMIEHFFSSLAQEAKWALHMKIEGKNQHHMCEVAFKTLGKALSQALRPAQQILSTKGSI